MSENHQRKIQSMGLKLIVILSLLLSTVVFAKKQNYRFEVLSPEIYSLMSQKDQLKYVNLVREAWVSFEIQLPQATFSKNSFQLFPTAIASAKSCYVGGAVVPTVKSKNKTLCSTLGRSCPGVSDSFLCGEIFNNSCISRTPIKTLSKRCLEAAKSVRPSKAEYERMVKSIHSNFQEICNRDPIPATVEGCAIVSKRITDISTPDSSQFVLSNQVSRPSSSPIYKAYPSLQSVYKGCPVAMNKFTGKPMWVPQFDTSEALQCQFNQNQQLLDKIAQTGCTDSPARPTYRTEITTGGLPSTKRTGFISSMSEVSRSSRGTVFNIQMVTYDLTKTPLGLRRENLILRENKNTFEILPTYDATSGRTANVRNYQANSVNIEGGITNLELQAIMTSTPCNLSKALRQMTLTPQTSDQGRASSSLQ